MPVLQGVQLLQLIPNAFSTKYIDHHGDDEVQY